ncbi:hypothetical protein CYY_006419 [Polysphondylium violaceum]|uniref:Uncharacterized protein n=1 Tax=Polysphondylium violaceum TaxID=133409 RepID=A0A8J4PQD4_9MYCE|nr:hypothetical protein CYY_006419 [Polysphondylium violaceum]
MSSPPNNSIEIIEESLNIFEEPTSSEEEVEYSFHTYKRVEPIDDTCNPSIKDITVRLSQKHSLWAHLPWNAGIALSDYFEHNVDFKNKNDSQKKTLTIHHPSSVLELGAGAGFPSFIAALKGAKKVVLTDYPDEELISNMKYNVNNSLPQNLTINRVYGEEHLWGKQPEDLFKLLENPTTEKFDIIILSDLIFNHTSHERMLTSCQKCLSDNGVVYVTFSHHRPNRMEKDLYFFEDAVKYGFESEKFSERKMQAMFDNDFGSEEVRKTVHFYIMKFKKE